MHRATSTFCALAVLFLIAPAANAQWMLAGAFEPDNSLDTPSWMWQTAAPIGEKRVYFSALTTTSVAGGLTFLGMSVGILNPNVGALQTQVEVPNSEVHRAMLGVWVDCNGDNYVGMAETAAQEYSATLLLDDSACPLVSGPPMSWNGAHNYNGWVSEYVPIARDPGATDKRVYPDDDARVWGDFHRPDERPWIRTCAISPQPRGTWHDVGGVINYADCRAGTFQIDPIGAMNVGFAAIGDPMGWHFSNTDDARSGALGRIETFGPEDDSNSAVQVWDCSREEVNETNTGTVVYGVDLQPGNTAEPTLPGTLNHTWEGAVDDCNTSNDFGHEFYRGTCFVIVYCVGEGDFNGVDPNNKHEANWNMRFNTVGRGAAPLGLVNTGQAGANGNAGLLWGGSGWSGTSYWLSKPGFGIVRTQLADTSNPQVGLAGAYWLTFYASVGPATTDRGFALPGGSGVYASAHCGDYDSGIHYGWNCNLAAWNINPDGTPLVPGGELENFELVKPGQPYQLRDVDCYDGGIGSSGLGVQPAFYGADPCV